MLDLEKLAEATIQHGQAIVDAGGSVEFFGLTIYRTSDWGGPEWGNYAIYRTSHTYLPTRYTWGDVAHVLTEVAQGRRRFVDTGADSHAIDVADYVTWAINRHGAIKIGGVIVGRKQGGGIAIRTSPKGRVTNALNEKTATASDIWDAIQKVKGKAK